MRGRGRGATGRATLARLNGNMPTSTTTTATTATTSTTIATATTVMQQQRNKKFHS